MELSPRSGGRRHADGGEAEITIRHLLTHTSGLRYGYDPAFGISEGLDQPGRGMAENLARIAAAPLAFAPEAPKLPALESPITTLIKNAPLPPGRPLDLDLPKAPLRAFVAPPKDDRRVALLQASDIRGSLPSR